MTDRPTVHARLAARRLRDGAEVEIRGEGWSMWPVVRPGDRLVARPRRETARVGQIVVVEAPAGLVTHRVARVAAGRVVTRGDRMRVEDPPARDADVVGVVARVRKGPVTIDLDTRAGRAVERVLRAAGALLSTPRRLAGRLARTSG